MNDFVLSPRGNMVLNCQAEADVCRRVFLEVSSAIDNLPKKVRIKCSALKWLWDSFLNLPPQTKAIGAHLFRHQIIDARSAIDAYRCRSVSSRISELRNAGWLIAKEWHVDTFGQKLVVYRFVGFKGGANV